MWKIKCLLMVYALLIAAMIGEITTIHSVNVGKCAPDENGTLVNCSLSDRDFTLLNNTQTSFSHTFGVITPLMWLLVLSVIVAALMLLASLRRGQIFMATRIGVLVLLLLVVSNVFSETLITDKRTESQTWYPGIHCVDRIVSEKDVSFSPVWSGPAALVSIGQLLETNYDVLVDDYDCGVCNETKEKNCSCKLIGSHVEVRTETKYVPLPLAAKKDTLAISVYNKQLTESNSFTVDIVSPGRIQVCFKVEKGDIGGGGHIMYVASLDGRIDACQSTLYNISDSAISFQPPTPANGTVANSSSIGINISITTDNLNSFKWNWNDYTFFVRNNQLAFYAPFNNAQVDNSTCVRDVSSYELCGTPTNIVSLNYTTGVYGNAIDFAGNAVYGSSPYLAYGNKDNLKKTSTQSYSFGAWVKYRSTPAIDNYVINQAAGQCDLIQYAIAIANTNQGYVTVSKACRASYSVLFPTSANTWYHVVGTYNGDTKHILLYVNGAYNGTATYGGTPASAASGSFDIGPTFNGSIDDVFVYDKVLSADDIKILYQSEFQKYNNTEYWFYSDIKNLSQGTYPYYGWANDSGNNAGQTDNSKLRYYTYSATTTTTTTTTTEPTTTTTEGSTTTTTPDTLPANSTLYIYSILAPVLATIFTIVALLANNKGILPSVFASTLWYASDMFSTRIRFPGDFTVSMTTRTIDAGNWEVGSLFLAFAAIMAVYTMVLILDFIYSNKQNG